MRTAAYVVVATLAVSAAIEFILGPIENYLARLTPIAVFKLDVNAYLAMAATLLASVFAYIVALIFGVLLGFGAASGKLSEREDEKVFGLWRLFSFSVWQGFQVVYVVPLVLTLTLFLTILLKAELQIEFPELLTGVLLVGASGVVLAGYRVFHAIYDAIDSASDDDLNLAKSLYLGGSQKKETVSAKAIRIVRETNFLVQCKISLIGQAVEQAFHLAVVGVVILEIVSGIRVYEKFFPSEGAVEAWSGGIGRVILDAQNVTNPELIAGAIWLILITDLPIAYWIRTRVHRRWVVPYRR